MHLLCVQIRWMMFMKILIITTEKKIKKVWIVFDEMIADIMTNKKFQTIIKELFIRCKKLNISLVFITQSYFYVPKDARLNTTHYFIMKINNNRIKKYCNWSFCRHWLQRFLKHLLRMHKKTIFFFLIIDSTLPASDPLRCRKNLFDSYKNENWSN